jgi:hypothetical protein
VGHWQTPPIQLAPVAQPVLQFPQWLASVCVLTHAPPQLVGAVLGQQMPLEHTPEQHCELAAQTLPLLTQAHVPDEQLPEQHWPPLVQVLPSLTQAHVPDEQLPEQHWAFVVHASLLTMHAHVPDEQIPEQQSGPLEQSRLIATQHLPFTQLSEQQSPLTVQVPPFWTQQVPPEQFPEQHWLLLVQVSRFGMHAQVPPEQNPEQQAASLPQLLPLVVQQLPLVQKEPLGHMWPQVPQLLESVLVLMHIPPQQLCPLGHAPVVVPQVHCPLTQVSPGEHVMLHPPQLAVSLPAVFTHVPPQLVSPAWQKLQAPLTQ